ncbi:MAG: UDP-3-O-(3-hydroxymyristoyl)glucosamine N-acyltransferase [Bacteroidia bacterium]
MIKIKEILLTLKSAELIGNDEALISDVIQLDENNTRPDIICWCNDKNIHKLSSCVAGTIICSSKARELTLSKNCNFIILENPRKAFSKVLKEFFEPKEIQNYISPKASIHESVKIGSNVFIGDFTVIEKDCVIGNNSRISYNTVIHQKTIIGSSVKIGSNNTIGGVGFGYEKDEEGNYEVLPHIGNVEIMDNVEIGNNTCIDRAVLGSTLIHKNVKIDNLVHVAHGVIIGENSLIIANAMLGGSTVIGKNVWVAPSVSIINKGIVEDDSLVGMGAVVVKPVKTKTIVAGNPAKFLKDI